MTMITIQTCASGPRMDSLWSGADANATTAYFQFDGAVSLLWEGGHLILIRVHGLNDPKSS